MNCPNCNKPNVEIVAKSQKQKNQLNFWYVGYCFDCLFYWFEGIVPKNIITKILNGDFEPKEKDHA